MTIPLIPEPISHWKIGQPLGPRNTFVGSPIRIARSDTGWPTYAAKPPWAAAGPHAKIVNPTNQIRSDFMATLRQSGNDSVARPFVTTILNYGAPTADCKGRSPSYLSGGGAGAWRPVVRGRSINTEF